MKGLRKGAMLAAAIGIAVFQGAGAGSRNAEIFNGLCNRCHGLQGEGSQSLEAPLISGMPAWYVEAQLHKFRQDLRGTNPKDFPGMRMRPMARSLYTEEDVKGIAEYVAALPVQPSPVTLVDANTAEGKAAIAQGEAASAICKGCHGMDAKGNQALGAPALAGQSDWYLLTQLKNFKADIRTGPMMKPIVSGMDETAMRNVAAYFGSMSGK